MAKALNGKRLTLIAAMFAAAGLLAAPTFNPELAPVGYVAQPDLTNYNLVSGRESLFMVDYEREFWSGNLYKYPVNAAGIINEPGEQWTGGARDRLELLDWNLGRKIVTMRSDGSKVPFRWAELSAAQQASIGTAVVGPMILNFVRGERSNEGATLRKRAYVLADIIHSRPYFVDGSPHGIVYVGSNGGMLHAFNADNGTEIWSYVPSMLIPKLNKLAAIPYVHTYFVDGTVNIANVRIGGADKKVLVGGLGAGGRGLYALDITNPIPVSEADAASKIMWEITNTTINNAASTTYANLGYTYATPIIGKINTAGNPHAVIMPNGYMDNTSSGKAALFVINIADGSLIRRIECTGTCGTTASPNGLSSAVAIDSNNNGTIDLVYAGDLDGRVWKFDLSSSTASAWFATVLFDPTAYGQPAQAITGTPAVAVHPDGGFMVNFGTGRMLTPDDATSNAVHWVYGIWDGAPITNTSLQSQTLTEKSYTHLGVTTRVRVSTANAMNWASGGHRGWKVALPAGERIVGEGSFIESARFYFTGYNPTIDNADPTPDGENWLMELDYLTGGPKTTPFLDLNGDLLLDDGDRIKDADGKPVPGTAGIPVGKFLTYGVASQPVLVQLSTLNTTLFAQNPDVIFPPVEEDRGVAGGHFDVDIYYSFTDSKGKTSNFKSQFHSHEYDDIYDVTGVNFLNASNTALNLSNAIPNASTRFKVLMANQSLNPAVTFSIGGSALLSIKNYQTSAGLSMASLPSYSRNDVTSLMANLPVNAFTIKDWWNTGLLSGFKVGLHPTQTGCVKRIDVNASTPASSSNFDPRPGPNGEWKNGAWVIQLVKDTTPDSAVQLNVAGDPSKGYRVKNNSFVSYVLAEYSLFWHHPNGKCYGDTGWTQLAPPDNSPPDPKKAKDPAPGSQDPKLGSFGTAATIVSIVTTVVDNVTTTVTTYSDGTTMLSERTKNDDGTVTIRTVLSDGTETIVTVSDTQGAAITGGDEKGLQAKTGRISWRELVRD